MQKFVVYRRLSKEDKARTQHGFDSQKNDILHFLDSQGEGEIIGDFKEFISGTAELKPELEKALNLCKETGATLLVAKLDRLSRRVSQIANHMESGVKFKGASLPNADNYQLHIYAALSEQERSMISDRVKRGLLAAKSKGVLLGAANSNYKKGNHISKHSRQGSTCYWEKYRVQVEGVVNMMKSSRTKLTFSNICNNLNQIGIVGQKGKPLSPAQTSRVLEKLNISRV